MRRNKDYIEDYRRYGKYVEKCGGKVVEDEKIRNMIKEKWNLYLGVLPNPDISEERAPRYCPEPQSPQSNVGYFSDPFGESPILVFSPGERTYFYHGGKELEHWAVYDYTKQIWGSLTNENCPRSISLTISIEPNYKRRDLQVTLMTEFEKAYQRVSKAQKTVFPKRSVRPRFGEFDKYIRVYDFKKANPKISWSDIAEKVFPQETYSNPNKRGKKKTLVSQTAIDKVRHYYREADKMINKGGWRRL